MADKRISQLVDRGTIANNDVVPIVVSGASTTNKATISSIQTFMQGNLDLGVTSVGLTMPSAFVVSASPVTTSGNISVTGAGTVSQYIRGNGTLADFPSISGGGSSVSYYLNGSVSQGTIGGVAYLEMNKVPILGTGTNFNISANGYIASFITDAGDPALLQIPGGNWNFETYFNANSNAGNPTFYIELYKVNSGGTATLIASNSATPEPIAFGSTIHSYFSTLAVPTTTLALTDRLALRYYVNNSGRTITLHTENGHLCQIVTTFTTGLTALNGLTAQVQNFATGTSGTDFAISSASTTHTFNLPDASATARGVVTTGTQTFAGYKIFTGTIGVNNDLQLATVGSALNTFIKNINSVGLTSIGSNGFGFNNSNNIYFSGSSKGGGVFAFSNTGTQTYTLQDASGTLAFTSQIPTVAGVYLPLTGGTLTGPLNGTSASFSGDIQSSTRLVAAAGGQQIVITPNLGGSSNRIETTGSLPLALVSAQAITLAAGGVTPQFTLATGGGVTLTGALNGTSASFTGGITASQSVFTHASTPIRLNNLGGQFTQLDFLNNNTQKGAIWWDNTANSLNLWTGTTALSLASTGAVTLTGALNGTTADFSGQVTSQTNFYTAVTSNTLGARTFGGNSFSLRNSTNDDFNIDIFNRTSFAWYNALRFTNSTGAATFSSSVTATSARFIDTVPLIVTANSNASSATYGASQIFRQSNTVGNGVGIAFGMWNSSNANTETAYLGTIITTNTAGAERGDLAFYTTDNASVRNERMRITSDGYARLSASSGGIQFNGDTAAANALDDYEEGTFTPTISGSTTAGTGTYTVRQGRYTKIGNMVYFSWSTRISAHTGTGSFSCTGLPFSSGGASQVYFVVTPFSYDLPYNVGHIPTAFIPSTGTNIVFEQLNVATGLTTNVPLDSNCELYFSGCYQTS